MTWPSLPVPRGWNHYTGDMHYKQSETSELHSAYELRAYIDKKTFFDWLILEHRIVKGVVMQWKW